MLSVNFSHAFAHQEITYYYMISSNYNSCLCGPIFGIHVLNHRKMLTLKCSKLENLILMLLGGCGYKTTLLCILARNLLTEPHKETCCEVVSCTRGPLGTEADNINLGVSSVQ